MQYFNDYTSNTTAGSGNQIYFNMEDGEIRTGRVLYKITKAGEFNYSLLFSNIIDSTYREGNISHKNLICNSWKIHSVKIGKAIKCDSKKIDADVMKINFEELNHNKTLDVRSYYAFDFKDVTINGQTEKCVMPGEYFSTEKLN